MASSPPPAPAQGGGGEDDDCGLALSDEVQATISQVIPSEDPLDRPNFNVIDFINQSFPDEQSLSKISEFGHNLQGKISEIDDELSRAIQEQSTAGRRAEQDISDAKQAIHELFSKVKEIKSKAEQSELMVAEICKDIKHLDCAKRNLSRTITHLKQLHMLITAADQLSRMAGERRYREAANLVKAVEQLLAHFDEYAEIPKIVELRSSVSNVKSELRKQVLAEFDTVGELGADGQVINPALLRDACAVVDALGIEFRRQLLGNFAKGQLRPYRIAFQAGAEFTGLEHTDRRFAWFRRVLRGVDSKATDVFPALWRVEHFLCTEFGALVREDLERELGAAESEGRSEVAGLLRSLQKTLMFEKEMSDKFDIAGDELGTGGLGGAGGEDDAEEEVLFDEDGEAVDPSSAAGIRLRYAREQKKKAAGSGGGDEQAGAKKAAGSGGANARIKLKGSVSGVFDRYMMPYILLERKNMKDMMVKVRTEERVSRDAQLPVFGSSVDMFVYIKNSIRRCTALSTGETFAKLFAEFQTCLDDYAGTLQGKLPAPTTSSTYLGQGEVYRLAPEQEHEICYIVNTSEYCAENLPKLQDAIEDKIAEQYKDDVDLDPQIDGFHDVAAHAVKTLVSGLEVKMEGAFVAMAKINWAVLDDVGDQSAYVADMGAVINEYIPTLRATLYPLYFRNVCDKFAMSMIPQFLGNIHKCKRISEMGVNQMLLDTTALKTLMLKLPLLGEPPSSLTESTGANVAPPSYLKFVEREMKKVETTLKLVQTPNEMLIMRFKRMWPDGKGADLQKILMMKGVKQADQKPFISMLGRGEADVDGAPAETARMVQEGASRIAGGMSSMMEGAKEKLMTRLS